MWLVEKEEGLVVEETESACAVCGVAGRKRGGAGDGGNRMILL